MFPPKKILFPVDFSERCGSAGRMVEIFTGHFEAELTLLHVLEPLAYNDLPDIGAAAAEERLGKYMADELKPFNVQRVMLQGDPASKIVEFAHSEGIDLIMLPTHGYSAFRRLILGSVTARVLHDAMCPVWTGAHMETVPPLEDIAIRRVVCAVDVDKQTCPTLTWAVRFASEFGAELSVVHAVPDAVPSASGYPCAEPNEALLHASSNALDGVLASLGATAELHVLPTDPANAVCSIARRKAADIVVIGRSATPGVMGRLRANGYSIVRQSPCPVISV